MELGAKKMTKKEEISLMMRKRRNHLKRMLVRSEQSLVVAPPLNEGEAPRFSCSVCQSVDHVLFIRK